MALAPRYPATRYELSPLVDLSARAERERLSPAAIKAFLNIMTKWRVRDEDARALLGGISNGQFYDLKKNPERTLDVDALTRIAYLIGIFKALNILHSEKLADAGCIGPTPIVFLVDRRRLPTSSRVGYRRCRLFADLPMRGGAGCESAANESRPSQRHAPAHSR
jgi:hypothetical protein